MEISVQDYMDDGVTWDSYVASHNESTNYHRYGWRKVIENSFGHKTIYLTAKNSRDEICGILPYVHIKSAIFGNFLVSLPFFNYGGLLSADHDTSRVLLDSSHKMLARTGANHIELRHLTKSEKLAVTKQHKVSMVLDLEKDEDDQWSSFNAKVRNQIRKAEKNRLRAITGSMNFLDDFYEVFSRNMRDLGTPVYNKVFFRNIIEEFPESTSIIVVKRDNVTIAAALLTWHKDTLEVPWASSVKDFREWCPNNLLYWEAIRFAIYKKARKFDFGRSTPGEGTYCFKKQWGAKPVQLYWQYLLRDGAATPEVNPQNPKYQLAIKTWRHLPLMVTNLLGPHIVRCIP